MCSFSAHLKKFSDFFEFLCVSCVEKTPFQSRKALLKFRYKITQNCPEITSFRHDFSDAVEIRFTYGLVRGWPCDVCPYIIYEDIEQPYAEVQRPVKKFTFKFLPNCFHVAAFWRGNSLFEIVLCLRLCRQNLPKQTWECLLCRRLSQQTFWCEGSCSQRKIAVNGLRYSAYVPLVHYSKFAWLTQDIKECIGQNISILFLNRIVPCLFYWRMFIEQRIWWTFFWLIARVSRGDSSLCFCSIKASKNQ